MDAEIGHGTRLRVEHDVDRAPQRRSVPEKTADRGALSSMSILWAGRPGMVDVPSDACSTEAMYAQQWLVTRSHIDFGRVWSCSC